MITKYRDFLLEARTEAQREHDRIYHVWKETDPEYWEITDYRIVGGLINCDHDIDLVNKNIKIVPINFGTVNGNFFLSFNDNLTSLYGSPKIVTGQYRIDNNTKLTSLKFFPKEVYGQVLIFNTPFDKNIENYPITIIHTQTKFDYPLFEEICDIIRSNQDRFRSLLDDKEKFHQEIMRLKPEFIPLYTTIKVPEKKSII